VLQTSSNELEPIDLQEYLFPANSNSKVIPYGVSSTTQQDVLASFPTSLQQREIFAITVSVSTSIDGVNAPDLACPVSGAAFGSNPRTVLGVDDSFIVHFASTIAPARVKICGRYQPHPIANNGMDGQYSFTHTVQEGDVVGPCILMVYLPWGPGVLAVYEQETGKTVEAVRNSGELCEC